MSREELLAFKEQNPQFFQEQEGGGRALETLRGVGDIAAGGKSFTFDPTTGRPFAVETGVKRPAAGGGINELISIEKFKLAKQLQEEGAEERKLKREKTALELGEKKEAQELKRKERERRLGLVGGEVTPDRAGAVAPSSGVVPTQAGQATAPQAGEFEEIITGFDESGLPTTKIQRTQAAEAKGKASAKRTEELSKARVNFEKTANLFAGIVSQRKGAEEEQGGLGLIPGLKGKFNVAIKNPDFARVASSFGQRAETAFALNSVLTGQNRVIRGVINMILGSLPDDLDPPEFVASKTAQSVRNAFMLTKALQQAGLTQNVLSKMSQAELDNIDVAGLVGSISLSPEEEAFIEAKINSILSAPVAKKRTLLGERGEGIAKEEEVIEINLD